MPVTAPSLSVRVCTSLPLPFPNHPDPVLSAMLVRTQARSTLMWVLEMPVHPLASVLYLKPPAQPDPLGGFEMDLDVLAFGPSQQEISE